jgi:hypothetical protein
MQNVEETIVALQPSESITIAPNTVPAIGAPWVRERNQNKRFLSTCLSKRNGKVSLTPAVKKKKKKNMTGFDG